MRTDFKCLESLQLTKSHFSCESQFADAHSVIQPTAESWNDNINQMVGILTMV